MKLCEAIWFWWFALINRFQWIRIRKVNWVKKRQIFDLIKLQSLVIQYEYAFKWKPNEIRETTISRLKYFVSNLIQMRFTERVMNASNQQAKKYNKTSCHRDTIKLPSNCR